jgi:hypothetical protein
MAPDAGAEQDPNAMAPEEEPAMAEAEDEEAMDNAEPRKEKPVNVKELAEFIGAFYNPNAREQGLGEWRKGPTELGIMAGKQFGDRAGRMVELMVTKMQERTQGHQEFAEVMKLAGLKTEENGPNKSDVPAYLRKKSGKDDWRVTHKDMEKDAEKNISSKQGLAALKKRTGIGEAGEFDVILRLAGLAK